MFFRKHTEEKAKELGLVGWVMNTPEGTVVGQAQGDPAALQTLRKWLQEEGSPKSRIDRCEFKNERDDLPALEFSSFGVKRPSRKKREESASGSSEKRKSREVAPSKDAGERKKKKEKTKKDKDEESSKVKKVKKEKKKKTKESA